MTLPWAEFGAIALAHAFAVVSPGPDFALVLRQSLVHGRRAAIWTSLGIGSGILVHVLYTLVGLGLLLRGSPVAFTALKLAGAAYLGWLGFQALRWARTRTYTTTLKVALDRPLPSRVAWRQGFLTNVLNPKAALFFVALFPSVVSAHTPRWVQAGYGVWMAVMTAVWFTTVSIVFAREPARRGYLKASVWIDRGLGVVFLGFAVSVALTARG